MCAATVFGLDDLTVGGKFVGAHAEHRAQRPGEGNVEAAVAAHAAGGPGHRGPGTEVSVMPALRGVAAAELAEHLAAAQSHLDGDLVDQRVTAGHVARHQPGVVAGRRQQITGTEVARLDPLLPRHPLGGQQRRRAGNQHDFANRGLGCAGAGGHDDRPLPAAVARHVGQESMRSSGRVLEAGTQVLAEGVLAAELDDRRARLLDGAHQHRLQVGAIFGVHAVHRHQ